MAPSRRPSTLFWKAEGEESVGVLPLGSKASSMARFQCFSCNSYGEVVLVQVRVREVWFVLRINHFRQQQIDCCILQVMLSQCERGRRSVVGKGTPGGMLLVCQVSMTKSSFGLRGKALVW